MTEAQRICLIFYLQPIALGAWLPHIPGVQTALDLSNSALALALIGLPAGTLTTLLVAGKLATWLGARRITLMFYPLFLLAMLLPFLAPSEWWLMGALALVGCSMSVLELGFNVLADEYETRTRHKIMSRAHGCWSFGLLSGTLIGAAVAGLGLEPLHAGIVIALFVQTLVLPATLRLPVPEGAPVKPEGGRGSSLPHPLLLGVCVFTFGTTLVEGAVADWAAVYLRDVFAAHPGLAGLGISIFSLCLASTRLLGDRLRQVTNSGRLGQGLALVGLTGLLLIWLAPSVPVALAGLGILGCGAALAFPLGVTAASAAPGSSPAANVAVLSFVALLGFLIGPLLIGPLADAFGIRAALMVLAPTVGLSLLLAPCLTRAESFRSDIRDTAVS
ncbi:MFS transporter [Roseibium sediminicola]|uniref:MFS transporter n=1 Tax=Roseibium sediminicola TaxID=2933272 RepID=A0ABT0GYI6_9HYPH|nr:MFS transporter [Roseibium sp. CAU 1639]MCK7614494.1 MFS transporter [Roseibium sp. CAU 1639]